MRLPRRRDARERWLLQRRPQAKTAVKKYVDEAARRAQTERCDVSLGALAEAERVGGSTHEFAELRIVNAVRRGLLVGLSVDDEAVVRPPAAASDAVR